MEMHQIRYFLAVCDSLNFTRAAESANVTQPALTRAIQKLEEELGGQLFRRERHTTRLTDLGSALRPHLENVLDQAETAKQTAQGFMKTVSAQLNMGVMCTVGPLKFVGFLADFRRRHPGIDVSVREGLPQELLDDLVEGKIDLALMARPEPFGERFAARPIYSESYVVAFPAGHRFQESNAVALEEIQREALLERLNCEYHDYVGAICRQRGLKAQIVYGSEREDWIQSMVTAGLGVCLVWESSPIIPGVLTRQIVDPEISREISLVSVAGRRFTPAAMTFARAIQAYPWRG